MGNYICGPQNEKKNLAQYVQSYNPGRKLEFEGKTHYNHTPMSNFSSERYGSNFTDLSPKSTASPKTTPGQTPF